MFQRYLQKIKEMISAKLSQALFLNIISKILL